MTDLVVRAKVRACGAILVLCAIACSDRSDSQTRERSEAAGRKAEVQRLTALLAQAPNDAALLRQLGMGYWALGDLDEAERSLKRSLAEALQYETQLDLISLLYRRGRYVEADALARRVVATYKNAVPAWVNELLQKFEQCRSRHTVQRNELPRVDGALVNSIGMRFVEVPGGSFVRGDDRGDPSHRPGRSITVSPYAIGQFEVTAGQFKQFVEASKYRYHALVPQLFEPERSEYPAAAISWLDAEAFTIWLSSRENAIYRLPTEAEWEFAARGVTGYREPWGNDRGREQIEGNWGRIAMADFRAPFPPLRPVGSFPRDRSPFGAFDMAGNVREWCLDEYGQDYYAWSPSRNPFGPIEQTGVKVLRGGSWNDPGPGDFALQRSKAAQNQAYTGYGFRVVRETGDPTARVSR